jgi:hypothetical protein
LSRREIGAVFAEAEQFGPPDDDPRVFNPKEALLAVVAERLGLGPAIEALREPDEKGKPRKVPMPFAVAAAAVLTPRVSGKDVSWINGVGLPATFVKAVQMSGVHLRGNQRFVLVQLSLNKDYDNKPVLPRLEPWPPADQAGGMHLGLFTTKPELALQYARHVLGAEPQQNGLLKVAPHGNLFSFLNFSRKRAKENGKAKAEAGSADELRGVYIKEYSRVIDPAARTPDAIWAGREAQDISPAMLGQMGRTVMGGQVQGIRTGEATVRAQYSPSGLWVLASRLLASEQLPEVQPGQNISADYGVPSELVNLMRTQGVTMPEPVNVPDTMRALRELRGTLKADYEYTPFHGQLLEQADSDENEFLAQLNPRGRKPRRPRKERAPRGARHNPWDNATATEASQWLGRGGGEAPASLTTQTEASRRRLFESSADITPGIEGLFSTRPVERPARVTKAVTSRHPPRSAASFDVKSGGRLQALTEPGGDVVGYLTPQPSGAAGFDYSVFQGSSPFPWRDREGGPAALDYVMEGVPLSLQGVGQILAYQKSSKDERPAMQASSAICKANRAIRVNYTPDLVGFVGKDTLILMSPAASTPRVMTFKRGVHMDCDMVGPDMGRLVGTALQAALLWLAERPSRKVGARVWVGRVGERELYLVWEGRTADTPISLAGVKDKLRGQAAVKPGAYTSEDAGSDAQEYVEAVKALRGRETRRAQRARSYEPEDDLPPSSRAEEVEPEADTDLPPPPVEPSPIIEPAQVEARPPRSPRASTSKPDETAKQPKAGAPKVGTTEKWKKPTKTESESTRRRREEVIEDEEGPGEGSYVSMAEWDREMGGDDEPF